MTWITHSLQVKNDIVEADPKEAGLRKILNFGHTIGHAIESYYLNTDRHLRHGEAIAIGMIAEAYLSREKTGLSETEMADLISYINSTFQPTEVSESDFDEIVQLALQDKKNSNAQIKSVLLESIGNAVYDVVIDGNDIANALQFFNTQIK